MGKQINILAIDDDPGIIYTFKAVAKLEDWDVTGVNDPQKGIEYAINGKYDVVLLDYHMPDMNGFEVLKEIREEDTNVIIIILTIDERYKVSQKFLEMGADDYAVKPIRAADLISRIKAHLNKNNEVHALSNITETSLPKGLSFTTLKKIYVKLKEAKNYLTLEEISSLTGISYQTVHRYLDFFEKQGVVAVEMKYGSVGRPTKKYKIKK